MRKLTTIVLVPLVVAGIFFATAAFAGSATVSWQACSDPDLEGYRVYCGTAPGIYGPYIPVGKVTTFTLDGLTEGATYYFVVTAVDTAGNESAYSSPVVSKTIPSAAPSRPSKRKKK